jgi:hypothetical protein
LYDETSSFRCHNNHYCHHHYIHGLVSWPVTVTRVRSVLSLKIRAFWDVSPCSLVRVDRRFRGAYRLYHQGDEIIAEGSNLLTRCRENQYCCSCRWGETTSLNCGHQRAYCSFPRCMCVWSSGRMVLTTESRRTRRKNLSQYHFMYHKFYMD